MFPAQDDRVARIELFGDEVESIRLVDPATQRSVGDATGVVAVARTELPPTAEIRERASRAAAIASVRPYLESVADRSGKVRVRCGSGRFGVAASPGVGRRARRTADRSLDDGCVVVVFDPARTNDEAAKAVEHEEELASLWADPAHLAEEILERPDP